MADAITLVPFLTPKLTSLKASLLSPQSPLADLIMPNRFQRVLRESVYQLPLMLKIRAADAFILGSN